MYTVKHIDPKGNPVITDTPQGHENRDFAISFASNMASKLAKEKRARVRATTAYLGFISFMVENSRQTFGGYAVSQKKD